MQDGGFVDFFQRATGSPPLPYQVALAEADITSRALAAPTGVGKTTAAVLAWLWQRQTQPHDTPLRLILCQPQRTLLEPVYDQVQRWLENLGLQDTVLLHTVEGGYLDQEWALSPEQPAVLIGNQDQLLSRALNRGYGMSRFRWPVHFGLFHNDVQWVFEGAQLMGAGLTTSAQLHGLRSRVHFGQARSLWLSAGINPGWLSTIDHPEELEIHSLGAEDRERLAARLHATKPLFQLPITLNRSSQKSYCKELAARLLSLHRQGQFTLVILNTVERARELFKSLRASGSNQALFLLHSRFRAGERRRIAEQALDPALKDKIVISTQVLEAVNISADLLVCELAPEASLILRFGRCNRGGEQDHAQVHWIDVEGDETITAPYPPLEMQRARLRLQELDSVEPDRFSTSVSEAWPLYDTLRRVDLRGLFDTAGDLGGMDIDVGRIIGVERDVFCYWREWRGKRPRSQSPAPSSAELCRVDLGQLRTLLKTNPVLWMRDTLLMDSRGWRRARWADLVPGRTFSIHCKQGLYHPKLGWDPQSTDRVASVGQDQVCFPFPTILADRHSMEATRNQTLAEHTEQVLHELELILKPLNTLSEELMETLRRVALWHDLGKAHKVFQQTMRSSNWDADREVLYARREGTGEHRRPYFRHELASALAGLEHALDFLSVYLVASHHGRARVSIRAFPGEEPGAILGICNGEVLPDMKVGGLELPATSLSLEPFVMGRGSWLEKALKLLDEYGPFRLAYLEALIQAADVRAGKPRFEGNDGN